MSLGMHPPGHRALFREGGGNAIPAFSPGCQGEGSSPWEPGQSPPTTPTRAWKLMLCTEYLLEKGEEQTGLFGSSLWASRDCPLVSASPWGRASWMVIRGAGEMDPTGDLLYTAPGCSAHLDSEQACEGPELPTRRIAVC